MFKPMGGASTYDEAGREDGGTEEDEEEDVLAIVADRSTNADV